MNNKSILVDASESRAARQALATAPEIMTIEQVAEYLQLHPQVVYRHVRAGTLPASRIGRTIRFKKSILDQFLESGAFQSVGRFMRYIEESAAPKGEIAALRRDAPAVKSSATPVVVAEAPAAKADRVETARPQRRFSVDVD